MTISSAREQARWGQELRAERAVFILINGPLAVINVKKTSAERAKESFMWKLTCGIYIWCYNWMKPESGTWIKQIWTPTYKQKSLTLTPSEPQTLIHLHIRHNCKAEMPKPEARSAEMEKCRRKRTPNFRKRVNIRIFAAIKHKVPLRIMINRELIRLKVVQLVYSYYQNEGKAFDIAEKELDYSLN